MKTSIIIPARYGSSRYRGKPLVKILGKEMVLRVADICRKVKNAKVFIATDSKKISNVAKKKGYDYILTSNSCLTGTDRVAEASNKIKSKIYVNVQGDEPTIKPNDIKKVIQWYNSIESAGLITLPKQIIASQFFLYNILDP